MASGDSDSDYEQYETNKKSKSGKRQKKTVNNKPTSNVNDQFICDRCGFISHSKFGIYKHIVYCDRGVIKSRTKKRNNEPATCKWCNFQFKNHGNLTRHVRYVHGESSSKPGFYTGKEEFKCHICDQCFNQNFQLIYHIRRMHYNMTAKIPYAHKKKVNQVWFENVLNSNIIMEIKKTGHNKLLMKKLNEHTAIKVHNNSDEIIDVSHLYPTDTKNRTERVECEICHKSYRGRDLPKHIAERHHKIIKHRCNNCNRGFKRSYLYLKHVCEKVIKVRGVSTKGRQTDIQITSVESLSIPFAS